MSEFKIDLDLSKINRESAVLANSLALQAATKMINSHYYNGKHGPKGVGYSLIEEQLNTFILSDKAQAHIAKIIEASWEEALTKATEKAIEHRAKRLAFLKLKKTEV